MLARLALALLFSAAIPAQPGCVDFRPSPTTPGMYWMRWHSLFADLHYVEFVPFGGAVAAIVLVGNHSQHSPTPITVSPNSCAARDVILYGWAWSHTPRSPQERYLKLVAMSNGVPWQSPPIDLRARPTGFMWSLIQLDANADDRLGMLVVDDQNNYVNMPALSAYLIAPASGGW